MTRMLNNSEFTRIFTALVRDCEEMLDLENGSLNADVTALETLYRANEEGTLLLELPDLCTLLETCLERGSCHWYDDYRRFALSTKHVAEFCGFPWYQVYPSIFGRIWSQIFDSQGFVNDSTSTALSIRCFRQLCKGFKKYRVDCPKEKHDDAIRGFVSIEQELISPRLSWGFDDLVCNRNYPHLCDVGIRVLQLNGSSHRLGSGCWGEGGILRDLSFIQSLADRIARSFQVTSSGFKPRHGPGAVAEKFRESKYEFPAWPQRLENHFPYDVYGMLNWMDAGPFPDPEMTRLCFKVFGNDYSHFLDIPAKLIAVPKSYKGPRLIASEPISAQYVQQGIMQEIRKCLKRTPLRHSIDFTSQEPSREMVLTASRDLDFSTIDLSSASDRLSCAVVESIFRTNFSFLEKLNAARTPSVAIELDDNKSVIELKKFAAQGAAFTFPVQSIVYAIIVGGVLLADDPSARLSDIFRKVRVYGDDMIVPSHVFRRVCSALEALQLKVNGDKSFHQGSFRESCGMDAFGGEDVSVANILDLPLKEVDQEAGKLQPVVFESIVSTVEAGNSFYMKGFIHTSRVLHEMIPGRLRKRIAWVDHTSTILGSVGSGNNRHLQRRYNHSWQCLEVFIFGVESKVEKTSPDGSTRLLQWIIEDPLPESVWTPGEVVYSGTSYCPRWVQAERLGTEA